MKTSYSIILIILFGLFGNLTAQEEVKVYFKKKTIDFEIYEVYSYLIKDKFSDNPKLILKTKNDRKEIPFKKIKYFVDKKSKQDKLMTFSLTTSDLLQIVEILDDFVLYKKENIGLIYLFAFPFTKYYFSKNLNVNIRPLKKEKLRNAYKDNPKLIYKIEEFLKNNRLKAKKDKHLRLLEVFEN